MRRDLIRYRSDSVHAFDASDDLPKSRIAQRQAVAELVAAPRPHRFRHRKVLHERTEEENRWNPRGHQFLEPMPRVTLVRRLYGTDSRASLSSSVLNSETVGMVAFQEIESPIGCKRGSECQIEQLPSPVGRFVALLPVVPSWQRWIFFGVLLVVSNSVGAPRRADRGKSPSGQVRRHVVERPRRPPPASSGNLSSLIGRLMISTS